jgi:hypothetical protein
MTGMGPEEPRTEEYIDKRFPDRGPAPSNEIVLDPNAEPVPDIGHPHRIEDTQLTELEP